MDFLDLSYQIVVPNLLTTSRNSYAKDYISMYSYPQYGSLKQIVKPHNLMELWNNISELILTNPKMTGLIGYP